MQNEKRDIKIYRTYIAQGRNAGKVAAICRALGISRGTYYSIIERVKNGNMSGARMAIKNAIFSITWEYKYRLRYESIGGSRKPEAIAELRAIIKDMMADEIPTQRIASLMKKSRSTIIHHINTL